MKITSHQIVYIFFIVTIIIGFLTGWKLSFFQNFQYVKLVNLTGLIYDILAVVLLSYVILTKDFIQNHIAHKISMFVIIFSSAFPAAIMSGTVVSSFFGSNISEDTKIYMYIFVCVSIVPVCYLFGSPVFEPDGNVSFKPEKRIKILGAVLLLMGFIFQIVAAFSDLISGA